MPQSYLRIGTAADIENPKERAVFRLLEIFPGFLSWTTLIFLFVFSWLKPAWVAVFSISFVIYWVLKGIYLSFNLRSSYRKMRKNEQIDWLEKLNSLKPDQARRDWRDICHLIVLPMYKEPLEIVRESILALKNVAYPKEKMVVVLAIEERIGESAREIAGLMKSEFGTQFFKFLTILHPAGIPGELAGKGANETFALKQAKETVIDKMSIPYENIVVTSLDADTVVFPGYFSCLTYHYLTVEKPVRTSYQPTPLFINNIWHAPSISRIFAFSNTFWHLMTVERPEKLITFSSHSMSFRALVDVGFKQTNVVSDDSRIFWQCLLHYDGDYKVQPIFYPVSMDANVAKTFWRTTRNIYRQQRRWAYGVGEIPYFLFGFLKNKKIPLSKKFSLGFELIEGHWSWATASFLIFFLGWLPVFLGGQEFSQTLFSYNLPRVISWILTIGMFGLVISAYLSILLLPPKPPKYNGSKYLNHILQWLLVPFIMIIFHTVPALDAQTRWMLGKYMGFWSTEKTRK